LSINDYSKRSIPDGLSTRSIRTDQISLNDGLCDSDVYSISDVAGNQITGSWFLPSDLVVVRWFFYPTNRNSVAISNETVPALFVPM
jgi:hypothetical protein